MESKTFNLIGPGKVGTSLAFLLKKRGYHVKEVVGRSTGSLERARNYLGKGVRYLTKLEEMLAETDFILLGVKDDKLADLKTYLWTKGLLKRGQILVHLSGVHPANIGKIPQMNEIYHLALHPLQSVADVEMGIRGLLEAIWSIEGDLQGVKLGQKILNDLNVKWVQIGEKDKALYHAAACIVSNYLVTLMKVGIDFLVEVGFSPELAQQSLYPLIKGTLENLKENSPQHALTGPISRGDVKTVSKHLEAIGTINSQWLEFYRALGKNTLEYARIPLDVKLAFEKIFNEGEKK